MELGKEFQKLELTQDKVKVLSVRQSLKTQTPPGVLVTADTASLQGLSLTGELEPPGIGHFGMK